MPKVIVKTGTTQDGEFDLDLTQFSWRERAYITDLSGTTPPQFAEKWFGVDPKTVIATIAVMMQRSGKTPDLDVLYDAAESAFTIDYSDLDEAEDDAGPPDEVSPPAGDESDVKPDESVASG